MTTACVATTTWNSIDLVQAFLIHYRRLGFHRALVMDFDSTDGTRDLLLSDEWRSFVTLAPFPGIASLDSSNLLLSIAKQTRLGPWCLFCDPDELLVVPSMNLAATLEALHKDCELVSIPRFNVTAPASVATSSNDVGSHVATFTLRIDRRHSRSGDRDIATRVLDPPWIFTAIPDKVLVRVDAAVRIGDGDHTALTARSLASAAPEGTYLLHYPIRRYATFRDKVDLGRSDFTANPHLPSWYGWHVRRWIWLADSGRLYEEYLQQFIRDEDIDRLLEDGTLCHDESVARFSSTAS